MKPVKLIATACVMAMLGVLTLNVAAQDFNANERTYLTFSSTVELPGVTLQPGTYLFKLADSQSNRHIVQVLSQDEKQIHATILAVPAERLEVTGENVVTFRETAENITPAVQYWYYPGDRIGHEFVYPKDQAIQIAQRTGVNVLSTEGDMASSGSTVSSTGPDGQTTEWKREEAATPATAEEPAEETVAPAEATQDPETQASPAEPTTSASSMSQTPTETRADTTVGTTGQESELPATASPLPLSGLIGLLSLGGALALRRK
ncbi:MAG: hypothetical protein ACREUC_04835 [Steroidobacteraceae bacterium]